MTVYGAIASGSSFSMFYYQGDKLKKSDFNVGMTADEFRSRLPGLSNIWDYNPIVTSEMLDASGVVTLDEALAEGWNYYIELPKWRDQDILMPYTNSDNIVAGNVPVSLTIVRTQNHSPPLSGSFKMLLDGVPLTVDAT